MSLKRYQYDPLKPSRTSVQMYRPSRKVAYAEDVVRVEIDGVNRRLAAHYEMPFEEVKLIQLNDPERWRHMQVEMVKREAQERALIRDAMAAEEPQEPISWAQVLQVIGLVIGLAGAFYSWLNVHTPLAGIGGLVLLGVAGVCIWRLWTAKS